MMLGMSLIDWSKYSRKEVAKIAVDILEDAFIGTVTDGKWKFAKDSLHRVYAYNIHRNVSTDPIFIHHPCRLADEVYFQMTRLDKHLTLPTWR